VIDDHQIKLRAERAGKGTGRIYTLSVACTDQYGNTGTAATTVLVPHDMRSRLIRGLVFQDRHTTIPVTEPNNLPSAANSNIIVMNEEDPDRSTIIRVYPNPSRNYFTVNIETANNMDKISVRLIDVTGRVLEVKNNLSGSQTLRMGNNLRAGLYFAEIRQGNDTKQIKLMKQE
jgi:hypothetical protein